VLCGYIDNGSAESAWFRGYARKNIAGVRQMCKILRAIYIVGKVNIFDFSRDVGYLVVMH
jgi:hypothetical protein